VRILYIGDVLHWQVFGRQDSGKQVVFVGNSPALVWLGNSFFLHKALVLGAQTSLHSRASPRPMGSASGQLVRVPLGSAVMSLLCMLRAVMPSGVTRAAPATAFGSALAPTAPKRGPARLAGQANKG
jgi:hypothetical protein